MQDKIQFYYNPMSRGRIVHWMLEEVGAPYEVKLLQWEKGDHKSPAYLAINPMGQVPSIVHKGVTVTETAAICAYLADAFPQAGLAPSVDSALRGAYYRWLFFAAGSLEYSLLDIKYPRSGNLASSHVGYGDPKDVVNTLEKALSNGFLVGDKFSAADLYLSSAMGWYLMNKDLEARPAFTHYIKLCEDRPAHKRFSEQADKLMKK